MPVAVKWDHLQQRRLQKLDADPDLLVTSASFQAVLPWVLPQNTTINITFAPTMGKDLSDVPDAELPFSLATTSNDTDERTEKGPASPTRRGPLPQGERKRNYLPHQSPYLYMRSQT
ncbi:hypothetical protein AAF712_016390 [Marasmius tenuissimus]|uniref:Uncharacterized protein n=1 Tax=Marasmius tenuissimus TaxID=585030 RepID=A0ABR2Z6T2_9AGAR